MARIKTGPIISDISGKLADTIFSRNKYGPYVKAYAAPVQPGSASQLVAQNIYQSASSAYISTSDTFKAAWDQIADRYLQTTFHNGSRKSFPRGLFIKAYMAQIYAGGGPNPQAQFPISNGFLKLVTYSPFADQFLIKFIGGSTSSDYSYILKSSVQKNLGIRSINSVPAVIFHGGTYVANTDINVLALWEARFGIYDNQDFNRNFISCDIIHTASGLKVGSSWNSFVSTEFTWGYDFINSQPWLANPKPDGWITVSQDSNRFTLPVPTGVYVYRLADFFSLNYPNILVIGTTYQYEITVPFINGEFTLRFGASGTYVYISSPGVYSGFGTCQGATYLNIVCHSSPAEFIISRIKTLAI